MVGDGTAAAQALANKEIDIYQGQPTADAVAQLKAISGVTVIGGTSSCFEHVDVRQGSINDTDYTGPFAASNNATDNLLDQLVPPVCYETTQGTRLPPTGSQ